MVLSMETLSVREEGFGSVRNSVFDILSLSHQLNIHTKMSYTVHMGYECLHTLHGGGTFQWGRGLASQHTAHSWVNLERPVSAHQRHAVSWHSTWVAYGCTPHKQQQIFELIGEALPNLPPHPPHIPCVDKIAAFIGMKHMTRILLRIFEII